jgi:hypothetical protein
VWVLNNLHPVNRDIQHFGSHRLHVLSTPISRILCLFNLQNLKNPVYLPLYYKPCNVDLFQCHFGPCLKRFFWRETQPSASKGVQRFTKNPARDVHGTRDLSHRKLSWLSLKCPPFFPPRYEYVSLRTPNTRTIIVCGIPMSYFLYSEMTCFDKKKRFVSFRFLDLRMLLEWHLNIASLLRDNSLLWFRFFVTQGQSKCSSLTLNDSILTTS